MAKTRVTSGGKRGGKPASGDPTKLPTAQQLATKYGRRSKVARLEAVEQQLYSVTGMAKDMVRRVIRNEVDQEQRLDQVEERLTAVEQLARQGPFTGIYGSTAQTPAPATTDAERDEADAAAQLRREMCDGIRTFFLEKWERELAARDLAFIASVWVEMLAVAIAGSVDMTNTRLNREAQVQDFVKLQAKEINRRVHRYVELRAAHPETGRIQ